MTPASITLAYRALAAQCRERVEQGGDLSANADFVFGAYLLAEMCGAELDANDTPSRWVESVGGERKCAA